jgi:hypothetical protein
VHNSTEEAGLLDVSVNGSWDDTAMELEEAEAIADEATIVSDADRKLREALVTEDRRQQLDLVHLVRSTGHNLWEGGELDLEDRKAVLDSVREGVYPLAAAVEWFREADADEDAASWLRDRIDETVDTFTELATNLPTLGCPKAAKYLAGVRIGR